MKISVTNSEETDGLDKLLNLEALALGQPATAEAKMSKFDENIHTSTFFISLLWEKLKKTEFVTSYLSQHTTLRFTTRLVVNVDDQKQ